MAISKENTRPESMARINTPELAKAFIDEQLAAIKKFKLPNGTSVCLVEDGEEKVKKVFDEETFKENEPLLYELYQKDKVTKGKTGFVKITLPKKKGN